MYKYLLVFGLMTYALPSFAGTMQAFTILTTPTLITGLPSSITLLAIDNEAASGGNSIACAFYGVLPAVNTAGSWTIPAGATRVWAGVGVPGGPINCIASGSSTPATVQTN